MTTLQAPADIHATVGEMVEIIVDGWDPLQIVMFGSRARGDHHEASDVDLLVVLDECEDRYQSKSAIGAALRKLETPTDVIVTTPALFLKRACLVGAVERKALIDGRVLYVRGGGDPVIEEALHELRLALEDLGTAELLLRSENQPLRQACFHAQQAAERRSTRRLSSSTTTIPASTNSKSCAPNCRQVGLCMSLTRTSSNSAIWSRMLGIRRSRNYPPAPMQLSPSPMPVRSSTLSSMSSSVEAWNSFNHDAPAAADGTRRSGRNIFELLMAQQ